MTKVGLFFQVLTGDVYKRQRQSRLKKNAVKVNKFMYSFFMKDNDVSFDNILLKINMSEYDYINAVRYGIDRDTIFLERNSLSVAINCHNSTILSLFSSNMDFKFVLDRYSCAPYIINYISKVETGLSRLLKEAASDVENEKMNTRGRLSKVANVFLNSNLMCPQEAAQKIKTV